MVFSQLLAAAAMLWHLAGVSVVLMMALALLRWMWLNRGDAKLRIWIPIVALIASPTLGVAWWTCDVFLFASDGGVTLPDYFEALPPILYIGTFAGLAVVSAFAAVGRGWPAKPSSLKVDAATLRQILPTEDDPPVADFMPLEYPTPWPPPRPERCRLTLRNFKQWFCEFWVDDGQAQIWFDMEKQICDQLRARRSDGAKWPKDSIRKHIVDALARAVRDEKSSLNHVLLHPDDPIVLLLWGEDDDLTPLEFHCNLESTFDMNISDDDWCNLIGEFDDTWWECTRTVAELVEQCLKLLAAVSPKAVQE